MYVCAAPQQDRREIYYSTKQAFPFKQILPHSGRAKIGERTKGRCTGSGRGARADCGKIGDATSIPNFSSEMLRWHCNINVILLKLNLKWKQQFYNILRILVFTSTCYFRPLRISSNVEEFVYL